MAKKAWKYDKITTFDASPSKEEEFAIALADLKLRESPDDPDQVVPPKAKAKGTIKGGTKFVYDKMAVMGTVNTPSDEASGFVRAIWYHLPAGDKNAAGWVLGSYQAPANSGKMESYVGKGQDGAMTWAGIKGAQELSKKPQGGGAPPQNAAPPPYENPPVDSPTGGVNPLIIVAIAVGIYLWTQRGK